MRTATPHKKTVSRWNSCVLSMTWKKPLKQSRTAPCPMPLPKRCERLNRSCSTEDRQHLVRALFQSKLCKVAHRAKIGIFGNRHLGPAFACIAKKHKCQYI